MRVIICGGRDYDDRRTVAQVLHALDHSDTTIIHGEARGADTLADEVARNIGLPVESYRADWSQGRAAGPIRNKQMLASGADLVVAFPGGKGTAHMVRIAREAGVVVLEVQP